jgi:hypothetical protein
MASPDEVKISEFFGVDESVDEIGRKARRDDQSDEGFGGHGPASNAVAQAHIGRHRRKDENA